jgi:hypothetical protein
MHLPFYSRFIGGRNIECAINTAMKHRWIPILDMAKEGNTTTKQVRKDYERIMEDLDVVSSSKKPTFFALKASTFAFECKNYAMMRAIAEKAKSNNIDVVFDAELSTHTFFEDKCISGLKRDGIDVYKTYQMYRKDALARLINDINDGSVCKFKIVRGAYLQDEVKRNIILSSKHEVDLMYDKAVKKLIAYMRCNNTVRVMVASHNRCSVEAAMELAQDDDVRSRLYFAQLLGMADVLTEALQKKGYKTCKYVPYGSLRESMPYLVRRLYENVDMLKHIK